MVSFRESVWYWWFNVLIVFTMVPLLMVIVVYHIINTFSDFCSKQRTSLQHRDTKPEITTSYVMMAVTTVLSIILYSLSDFDVLIIWSTLHSECTQIITVGGITYVIGKAFMYLTFILRLHIVFKGSMFEYKKRHLSLFAIVIMIETVILVYLFVFFTEYNAIYYQDLPFAMHCDTHFAWYVLLTVGLMDTIIQMGYLYAFANPLRLMLTVEEKCASENFRFISTKSLILSFVATISTQMLMVSLILMKSVIFTSVDVVINSISMMLMLPYYDNDKYYKKLCCLMIKMSDRISKRIVELRVSSDSTRKPRTLAMDADKGIYIHKTVMGMYLPHIFATDWMVSYWETNKKMAVLWMYFLLIIAFIGIIFGVIYDDFAGWILVITMNIAAVGINYVGTPFNGLSKLMSLPHLINIVAVVYDILRLSIDLGCSSSFFCRQITYENKVGLFVYLLFTVILWTIAIIIDFVDIYIWFIKGDHVVWRSKKTLDKLKEIGVLDDDITQIQVIQTNNNKVKSINKYGYKTSDIKDGNEVIPILSDQAQDL